MAEKELIGKKIEEAKKNEKITNISKAIENMENYRYQYNIKLVGFPELFEHESANDTANPEILIAHRVQSRRDIVRRVKRKCIILVKKL